MSRVALPVDKQAAQAADSEFYAKHPEFVQDCERIPLHPNDPTQRELRDEWIRLYQAKLRLEPKPSSRKPFHSASQPCLRCKLNEGELLVQVIEPSGAPVEGATVKADDLKKLTDKRGNADFGIVPVRNYGLFARKVGYKAWGPFPNTVNVASQEKASARQGLESCIAYTLKQKPLLIARADEKLTPQLQTISISSSIDSGLTLAFGQDSTHGTGGLPVTRIAVGSSETDLKAKMSRLVDIFASNDIAGNAKREFNEFQPKKTRSEYITIQSLMRLSLLTKTSLPILTEHSQRPERSFSIQRKPEFTKRLPQPGGM